MPTRVVVGGVGVLPGTTMEERRQYVMSEADHLRRWLMFEPHGHGAMSGAILQPPTRPDCDWGVVYIEVSGCLPMCGHGTIGTATVLVETGMVPVLEPETVIRLDTPARGSNCPRPGRGNPRQERDAGECSFLRDRA